MAERMSARERYIDALTTFKHAELQAKTTSRILGAVTREKIERYAKAEADRMEAEAEYLKAEAAYDRELGVREETPS